jgi:hypothetical protein
LFAESRFHRQIGLAGPFGEFSDGVAQQGTGHLIGGLVEEGPHKLNVAFAVLAELLGDEIVRMGQKKMLSGDVPAKSPARIKAGVARMAMRCYRRGSSCSSISCWTVLRPMMGFVSVSLNR